MHNHLVEPGVEGRKVTSHATLALGSQPKQEFARVQAKSEARESHLMLLGAWESVRE
jgi:hypothetical protein